MKPPKAQLFSAKGSSTPLPPQPEAEKTPVARRSFLKPLEQLIYNAAICRSPAEVRVLWKLYRLNSIILLFWLGSRDQVRKALKFLYCTTCSTGLLKAQNRNCTIAAVGSSIAALIGITSMAIFTDKVHWLCRAAWNFSVFSAFLSAALACKHTRFINNILLEDAYRAWDLKKWFHSDSEDDPAHPPLSIVLLLSGTEMFFDTSVAAYVVGLGIYLGCVWQQNPDSSQNDERNIFILYLMSGFFCLCVYCSVRFAPRARESEEWSRFLSKLEEKEPPFLCTMRLLPGGEEECVNPEPSHATHRHPVGTSHTIAETHRHPTDTSHTTAEIKPPEASKKSPDPCRPFMQAT